MPSYKFNLPDGRSGRFEATDPEDAKVQFNSVVYPDMMRRSTDEPAAAPAPAAPPPKPKPQVTEEQRAAQLAADKELYSPSKGMPWYEKFGVGLHGGVRSAVTGAADLVGLASPEMTDERQEWDQRKGDLGNWGTAGELVGEAGITAPVGGPIGKAGQILTKAVPALGKLAARGGRVLNLGTATRGAAEGAAAGAIVGDSKDKTVGDRADNLVGGGAGGAATPLIAKLVTLPITLTVQAGKGLVHMLAPTASAIQRRAYEAIRETIGEEGITNALRAMNDAGPSMVPHTTAAMSGSSGLGALERGARARGNADFGSHDESVARSAWDMLNDIPAGHRSEAGEVLRSRFMRNGVVQTPKQFGVGEFAVPEVRSHPLRRTLGQLSPHLSDMENDTFRKLADDLTAYDTSKYGVGATSPDLGGADKVVSAGLAAWSAAKGSPTIWKVRSAFNSMTGGAKDKTIKEVDEALLDPDKFMNMVDQVRLKLDNDLALTKAEQYMKDAVLAAGRAEALHKPDQRKNQRY